MSKIKIAFLDVVGLRYNGHTLNKRGLGGSESATIYMAKELSNLGFDVTVFCKVEENEGDYDGVRYLSNEKCKNNTESFDILVTLRSCVPYIPIQYREGVFKETGYDILNTIGLVQNSKYKILWLHDTFCSGDNWLEHICIDGFFDEIFTLSDWHSNYIMNGHVFRGRIFEVLKDKIWQTRNGIRNYNEEVDISKKDKDLFVYNASVSKGMTPLLELCWGKIRQQIPTAKLMVIGGYYRGANHDNPDEQELQWMKLKDKYDGKDGVYFTGIISQREISEILSKASLMVYPSAFPETFGISTLESLNYNTPVVTCKFGALEETAIPNMCYLINYDINYDVNQVDRFVAMVVKAYNDDYLRKQKMYACNEVKEISTWDTVALQWKEHFYNKLDLYMDNDEKIKVKQINQDVQRIFKRRFLNKEDIIETSKCERHILVVTPVYNAEKYIKKCIESVANQSYNHYTMKIIDDMSTDNTFNVAKETIENLPKNIKKNFKIIKNTEKKYAVTNQVEAITDDIGREVNNNDLVILLDGDDWLDNNSGIFNFLDNTYDRYNCDMTYGSCHSLADNIDLIAEPYPENVIKNKSFKTHLFSWGMPYTHLRTFKISLFEKLDKSLFKDENGNHWKAGGDNALFYPLLENANSIKCIQRVLMVYNDTNPLNDYKINSEEQTKTANKIRGIKALDYKNIGQSLYDIHIGVENKDEEALACHKDILENREIVWIDNTDTAFIKPRRDWFINQLKKLNIPKEAKILDIGAWTGALAVDVYNQGYHNITCLDISKECVKMGSQNFPFLKWIQGDIESVDIYDRFDIIFMGEIVEHLVKPYETIDKIKTWLNENGAILYTIPTKETVFGETKDSALEHIAEITEEDLSLYSTDIEILNSDGFFKWYVGSIKNPSNEVKEEILTTNKRRILCAIPTAKNIETDTFKSIYNLTIPEGFEVSFECFYGYNIDQVRNLMADYTINNNFDYIFCVDSDIVFPKDSLVKLVLHKKDIVSGIYKQRFLNENRPELYLDNGTGYIRRATMEDVAENKLLEVSSSGFGCTLISKDLLKKIGYPQFEYHSSIDFNKTISEDTDFCIKARKCGSKVYVDTSIRCGHIGSFELKI